MKGFLDDRQIKNTLNDTEWTNNETDRLLNLYLAGTPPSRLAVVLNRNPKAIKRRLEQFTYNERGTSVNYRPTSDRVSRKGKRMTENEVVLIKAFKERSTPLAALARILMRDVSELGLDRKDLEPMWDMKRLGTTVDLVLAYRYLYYCKGISVVSDQVYDELEKEETEFAKCGEFLKKGPSSDNPDDYPPHIRALGLYLAFKWGESKSDRE